jgi:Flp pilus assembly protein CpaB
VLVAWSDIVAGTLIDEPTAMFGRCWFTKGTEPKGVIRDPYEVKNRRLARSLAKGQLVTAEDLTDYWTWIASNPWPREVERYVEQANVVGGFIVPNSRVDIQSVVTDPEGRTVATTIIENALVLRLYASRRWGTAARLTIQVRTPEEQERLDNQSGTTRLVVKPCY